MATRIKGKQKVKFKRLNWDICCYHDLISGNGFMITEPASVSLDGSKKKTLNGPQSPKYGTTYADEQAYMERFSCNCGEFKSKQFEGEICPLCKSKVQAVETNIETTGWVTLAPYKIINPYYYQRLKTAFGKTIFPDIITVKQKVDTDGHCTKAGKNDYINDSVMTSPFYGIGIQEFISRFDEICDYFLVARKTKAKVIKELIKERNNIFISHIPIYSTAFRPQSITSDSFYYVGIDKQINTVVNLSLSLRDAEDIEIPLLLNRIQNRVNKMWEYNFELINGKDAIIRGQILGGALNNTSRNVIVPDPTLRDNEVDMSYHTFRELFKYELIYYILQLYGVNLSKAYGIWKKSYIFSEEIYQIMMYMIKDSTLKILINRNPTLNYYSMLLMSIRSIKRSETDYTLSLPLSVLNGLNADFDGDILNIIGLPNEVLIDLFRKFDPVERMIISRDSGTLNEYFSISKSQLIDLYYFATMEVEDTELPVPIDENEHN